MKLITHYELSKYSTRVLSSLWHHAFDELVKCDPESHERRNALASLENIQRVIASRDHGF